MIHFTIWNIIFAVVLLVLNKCIPYIPEITLPDFWFLK
jgi:hypothetical protein